MARIVQDGAMPRQIPKIAGIEVAPYLKPARFIGGDFLRFIESDSRRGLGILIGDVCGKGAGCTGGGRGGLPFNERTALEILPGELMGRVNISLKEFPSGAGSRFNSTALWGVFNLERMIFTYCSAGHDFPLHLSAKDGTHK